MTAIHAIILGLVQGITEFLPISSSGHLIVIPKLLGWVDQGLAFDAMIHLGTLLAVVVYFWKDIVDLLNSFKKTASLEQKLLRNAIIISMIPAGFIGFFFKDYFEDYARNLNIIVFNLIFWGVILIVADRFYRKRDISTLKSIPNYQRALYIGIAQVFALIPGTSRSGSTISAGLFFGLSREASVKFSFLMGVPLIFAAGCLGGIDLIESQENIEFLPAILGLAFSFLGGLMAIHALLKFIKHNGLTMFGVYRIILAVTLLLVL